MRRGLTRALITAATLATLLFGSALPAFAHNTLTGSDPKDGATLDAAPEQVVLTFDQAIGGDGTGVVVQGPGDARVEDGAPQVTDNKVVQPLKALTEAGEYRVGYRAVSADGHPVTGEVTFTLSEAAVEAGAGSGGEASAAPESSAPATPSSPRADPAGAGDSSWVWPAGIAAAVVIAGAIALFLLRRRDT
ncbi:MAG: copper resistance protein CopC [Streptosporangiales bacterium]|nr:copper resistance protein CopC [Streptosporangiales bacterium]